MKRKRGIGGKNSKIGRLLQKARVMLYAKQGSTLKKP